MGDIQAHLLSESRKGDPGRSQTVIHPSEMAKGDWCPRQTFYRISLTPETEKHANNTSYQLANVFEEGHQIHRKWQTWLWKMGRLSGYWVCDICEYRWEDTAPDYCPHCNSATLEYAEVPLTDGTEHGITGHADGAITDLNALIEIKSIGLGTLRFEEPNLLFDNYVETVNGAKVYDLDNIWRNLTRPFPSHLRQANIYLHLCELMGLPYDKMIFLYEFKANQSVKEFVVKKSEAILEPLLDKTANIEYSLRVDVAPRRPPGLTIESKTCTTCPYKTACWVHDAKGKNGKGSTPQRPTSKVRLGSGEATSGDQPNSTGLADPAETRGQATNSAGRHNGLLGQGTDQGSKADDGLAALRRRDIQPGRGRREVRRSKVGEGKGTKQHRPQV